VSYTIYSAKGCVRCNITKTFMKEQGMAYEDVDIKGEGMDAFRKFYAANRKSVYRGEEGLEFPILSDGTAVLQGVGVAIAYLQSGNKLDAFIGRSELSHGWIDGLNISGGDPTMADDLIALLKYLKAGGLQLQLDTNGKNSLILERLLDEGIGDRVILSVKGPLSLYNKILGEDIEPADIEKTISLVPRFPEYEISTTIAPVRREGEPSEISYLMPDEIGETAKLISEAGGDELPYLLRVFDPETCPDKQMNEIEILPSSAMFKYRTAAREYLSKTEIAKE
jgi:pyruvate-formate lyase-activating enzyme/glutaredoxin